MADVGRPPEYNATKAAKAVEKYIKHCQANNFLPKIEGLAVSMGIARATLYDWIDPKSDRYHEEFSDIIELMLAGQADQLLQNGLVGNYNARLVGLMLSKHIAHDRRPYIETKDVTSDGKRILINDLES